jgi:hypothetical protein
MLPIGPAREAFDQGNSMQTMKATEQTAFEITTGRTWHAHKTAVSESESRQ